MSSQTPIQADKSISYEDISNDCVNYKDGGLSNPEGCNFFFPRNKTESLVQSGKVRSTICETIQANPRDIRDLVSYIMKHANQVFLILVYTRMVGNSWDIKKSQFKDENLPVYIDQQQQICNMATKLPSNVLTNGAAPIRTSSAKNNGSS
jgi:hypothetical protein